MRLTVYLLSIIVTATSFVMAVPQIEGLQIDVIKAGDGKRMTKRGDTIDVHYTGTLAKDGSKFDSSLDRKEPLSFTVGKGQVIKGWDEGLLEMSVGEKRKLTIQPDLAYGARGHPPVIPPNSALSRSYAGIVHEILADKPCSLRNRACEHQRRFERIVTWRVHDHLTKILKHYLAVGCWERGLKDTSRD